MTNDFGTYELGRMETQADEPADSDHVVIVPPTVGESPKLRRYDHFKEDLQIGAAGGSQPAFATASGSSRLIIARAATTRNGARGNQETVALTASFATLQSRRSRFYLSASFGLGYIENADHATDHKWQWRQGSGAWTDIDDWTLNFYWHTGAGQEDNVFFTVTAGLEPSADLDPDSVTEFRLLMRKTGGDASAGTSVENRTLLAVEFPPAVGPEGPTGPAQSLEAADLHTAYFPDHFAVHQLPNAAGEYELEILDPVNIALALVAGDRFIVHAALSNVPAGVTTDFQIRGRDVATVETDQVAAGLFTTLTLQESADDDRTWRLYLRGTKPATSLASLSITLREIVGVRGGSQPFASSVARMIEDYTYHRLASYYGVTVFRASHLYVQGEVVLDLVDYHLYRYRNSFGHSAPSLWPSQDPTNWVRLTWPEPANWALETPAAGGLQLVPPSRVQYRLPPAWDGATSWPNAAEVLHADGVWRNGSGGALLNVEPGTTDDWTRIADFSAAEAQFPPAYAAGTTYGPGDQVLQQRIIYSSDVEQTGVAPSPTASSWTLIARLDQSIQPSFQRTTTPDEPNTLRLSVGDGSAEVPEATDEFPGLLAPAEHAKLEGLLNTNPRGAWADGIEYLTRNIVYDYNAETGITIIAEAMRDHVASLTTRPAGIDRDTADWHIIARIDQSPHARTTALLDARIVAATPTPASQWRFRNAWAVGTDYVAADVVTREVEAVLVLAQAKRDHTSSNANPPTAAASDDWAILWTYNPATAAGKLNALEGAQRLSYNALQDKPTIPEPGGGTFTWRGPWLGQGEGSAYAAGETVGFENQLYTSNKAIAAGSEGASNSAPTVATADWDEIMSLEMEVTSAGVVRYRLHFGGLGGGDVYWSDLAAGGLMLWRGAWATGVTFGASNFTTDGGWIWRARVSHASTDANRPPHAATWERIGPAEGASERTMVWYGDWVRNVAFPEGRVVRRSGHIYIAHNNVGAGIEPGVTANWGSFWTELV